MSKRLLIAGGTGLIGQAVIQEAKHKGWQVTILSRTPGEGRIHWDPVKAHIALSEPLLYDVVINLAGASIAGGRWTSRRKKLIVESRLQSCATLKKYFHQKMIKTDCYIGASAIGIYGSRDQETVDELTPVDSKGDWLAQTTESWEEGHHEMEALNIRTIILRIGLVLSRQGGALKEILQTAPFGFLGYFGHGRQQWSWIHIEDVARIIIYGIDNREMEGIYLATSPFPVSNKALTSALCRQYVPRRIVLPVPALALSLVLGEMHTMLLQDCRCYPQRLMDSGFQFRYVKIDHALENLIGRKG